MIYWILFIVKGSYFPPNAMMIELDQRFLHNATQYVTASIFSGSLIEQYLEKVFFRVFLWNSFWVISAFQLGTWPMCLLPAFNLRIQKWFSESLHLWYIAYDKGTLSHSYIIPDEQIWQYFKECWSKTFNMRCADIFSVDIRDRV